MNVTTNEYFLVTLVTIYVLCIIWGLNKVLSAVFIVISTQKFRANLNKAIKGSSTSWEDIKHLQEDAGISPNDCLWVLNKAKTSLIVSGEQKEKERSLIESYIAALTQEAPYEGIPENIKIHLVTIQEQLNGANPIALLVKEIKALIASNKRESIIQKACTIGGFIVGVVGIVMTIIN
ncbi:hypothetical protein [Aeromonas aquatica]|uniref:hypothetical protein n=1 Tax=Aeromonas aquatica TaxID=558964 RepID=UPI00286F9455|nr:hypothetical protein [Aeromonas aquatica]